MIQELMDKTCALGKVAILGPHGLRTNFLFFLSLILIHAKSACETPLHYDVYSSKRLILSTTTSINNFPCS
jgi:hypothetical protein